MNPEMTEEEKKAKIESLLTFDVVSQRMGAKPHEIYRWISIHKMPCWLVDGALRFEADKFEEWLKGMGSVAEIRKLDEKLAAEAIEIVTKAGQRGAAASSSSVG